MTLKTFSAIPTNMVNIRGKFHWNPSTKYRAQGQYHRGSTG